MYINQPVIENRKSPSDSAVWAVLFGGILLVDLPLW
jgi:hypothetical protein